MADQTETVPVSVDDGPPAKKSVKRSFNVARGNAKPQAKIEPGSFVILAENRMTVAVSLADLSVVMNTYATNLAQTLPQADREAARWGLIASVAYDIMLLVEKQHQSTTGVITQFHDKPFVSVPDVLAASIEALSSFEHATEKVTISVNRDQLLDELAQITRLLSEHHGLGIHFGDDDEEIERAVHPLEFPWTTYLVDFSKHVNRLQRGFIGAGNWRIPTPKPELSLLTSGVVINGNNRLVVSSVALTTRLEYLAATLGLIEYHSLGLTSYIPYPTVDEDRESIAARVALRSGRQFTRDVAMRHLLALNF